MQAISPEAHESSLEGGRPSGIKGWLLVLCLVLLVLEPVSFAVTASQLLPSLGSRDAIVTVLLAGRLVVVGVGVGAGLALSRRQPQGVVLAQIYLAMSSALSVFLRGTSFFPERPATWNCSARHRPGPHPQRCLVHLPRALSARAKYSWPGKPLATLRLVTSICPEGGRRQASRMDPRCSSLPCTMNPRG